MKPKNNYFTPFIIVGVIAIPLVLWYSVTNSVMEKLLILFIFATFVLPLTLGMISICINMLIKPVRPNSNNNNVNYIQKNNATTSIIANSKPKKGGKSNPSKYYPIVRNSIIAYMKQGILTREDILTFKSCLDGRLGNRASMYNNCANFQFQNDANEIYAKLKSSVLRDDDYKYLIEVLNSIIQDKQRRCI